MKPTLKSIKRFVRGLIAKKTVLELSDFKNGDDLRERGMDSLDFLNIVFELEDEYNIEIEEDEMKALTSVDSFAKLIQQKLPNKKVTKKLDRCHKYK